MKKKSKVKQIILSNTDNNAKIEAIEREFNFLFNTFYKELGNELANSNLPCKERAIELLLTIKNKYV